MDEEKALPSWFKSLIGKRRVSADAKVWVSEAEFRSFVERLRNHYVDQFKEAAREMAAKDHPVAPEVRLELDGPSGLYENLYCVDFLASNPDPQFIEFGASYVLKFSPMVAETEGLIVSLTSTAWDEIRIRHDADLSGFEDALKDWFDAWFDLEGERQYQGEEGLDNVIHSFHLDGKLIHVDFGSAETKALWSLIALLKKAGAKTVWISSDRDDEEGAASETGW